MHLSLTVKYIFPIHKLLNKIKGKTNNNENIIENAIDENLKNYNLFFKEKPIFERKKLQSYSEERNYDEFIWINSLHLRILNILDKSYNINKDVFIITDVRFKNEMAFINKIGGIIVKINTIKKNNSEPNDINLIDINNHISETRRIDPIII